MVDSRLRKFQALKKFEESPSPYISYRVAPNLAPDLVLAMPTPSGASVEL
jgi:hypothetical protein